MCNALTNEDWIELQRYRIFKYEASNGWPLYLYNDLNSYKKYLEKVSNELSIDSLQATASVLVKRLSFPFIGYLYMLTVHDKRIAIQAENTFLVDRYLNKMWMPDFHLKDISFVSIDGNDRNSSFRLSIEMFFKEVFYPLIEKTYRLTKLSKWIMWENIAVYVYWLYDDLQGRETLVHRLDQLKDDFEILLNAQGQMFGNVHQNPLKKMYNKKVFVEEYNKEIRPRTTCCFSYLMNNRNQSFCSTCPKKSCYANIKMSKTSNGFC
ncbi:hypothetical protein CIB95_10410 [Lottiidibacillus patelloidae]|uniref:Uncharacterized protein n=1 Tax=Lottiidibacillus patelloidae TaxID=2670334 RepID=A0A263BST2_9BACI|nr:IucA/IucC family C-terminal-domain containing protein [Lottiidibacillus patelloidae]OZM56628.1 hypothetical protein CIB95_10410 [Lottiidibacillus patelloidae]